MLVHYLVKYLNDIDLSLRVSYVHQGACPLCKARDP